MKYLLDTHMLLWAFSGDRRGRALKELITDPLNEVYFSPMNIWEIAIKHKKGKLTLSAETALAACREYAFRELPVKSEHAAAINYLRGSEDYEPHNDPFDNILIAQAKCEGMALLTADAKMGRYLEPCIRLVV